MPTRREFLQTLGGGFGAVALTDLLAHAGALTAPGLTGLFGGLHHPAKVRRVIQLFMNGGASQMDLFDHKPLLNKLHGERFDPGAGQRVEAATSTPGTVLKPPFALRQRGQSGRWMSDLLPHLAQCADDMTFLLAIRGRTNVHGPGSYLMNTGFLLPGFPSLGSWISYALGTLADNLPTFVVLPDARGLPYNQKGNFGSGFLPVQHQGTVVNTKGDEPIAHLAPPAGEKFTTPQAEKEGLSLLKELNQEHDRAVGGDPRLEARIEAYELAAKMQLSAPEVFNLSGESQSMHALYGLNDATTEEFGRRCLLARRLIERGVRFVQVWSGPSGAVNNWDNHGSIVKELPPMCASTDKPIAGLLVDLKQRGLLDDTLVLWNTEFGRMPFSQGSEGRDHNGGVFAGWMCGAGVKPGVSFGQSDDWSWQVGPEFCTTYDFHATVLHLLGIDHERLTVRHSGANRRLTDVHGRVIHEILT
jgi:hypothetical protein